MLALGAQSSVLVCLAHLAPLWPSPRHPPKHVSVAQPESRPAWVTSTLQGTQARTWLCLRLCPTPGSQQLHPILCHLQVQLGQAPQLPRWVTHACLLARMYPQAPSLHPPCHTVPGRATAAASPLRDKPATGCCHHPCHTLHSQAQGAECAGPGMRSQDRLLAPNPAFFPPPCPAASSDPLLLLPLQAWALALGRYLILR